MESETAPEVTGQPVRASRKPYLFVLQCGIITSVLALAGVYWLDKNTTDFHIMGWYANYVIPAGAILAALPFSPFPALGREKGEKSKAAMNRRTPKLSTPALVRGVAESLPRRGDINDE